MAETLTAHDPHLSYRELAERTLVTAMTVNPLAAMDRSELLAALARVAARAGMRPELLARHPARPAASAARITAGTAQAPAPTSDRQFADAAFRDHPLYRRLMLLYVAWRDTLFALVDELDL